MSFGWKVVKGSKRIFGVGIARGRLWVIADLALLIEVGLPFFEFVLKERPSQLA
jgi:hypothetical protein